jgi:hypothetical protein
MGLADENPSASADDTVPRDASPAWAGGHGVSSRASPSAKPQCFGELSIAHNPAARNLLHQAVDSLPRGCRRSFLLARFLSISHFGAASYGTILGSNLLHLRKRR